MIGGICWTGKRKRRSMKEMVRRGRSRKRVNLESIDKLV